jgi:hypothetical protein
MLVYDAKLDAVLDANCCPKNSQDAAVLKNSKDAADLTALKAVQDAVLTALKAVQDAEKKPLHKDQVQRLIPIKLSGIMYQEQDDILQKPAQEKNVNTMNIE